MGALWLQFIACSLLILVSGAQLLRQGDRIARLTGLGGSWIGVVLLATVTSLPELVSGVTAVTGANAPNLAVGDVLGSCVFNLAMIAVLDALQRPASVFLRPGSSHKLGAAFSIVTLALIGMALVSRRWPSASLLSSSMVAPCLVLLYAMAMRAIFVHERSARLQQVALPAPDSRALRRAMRRYVLAAAIVVAAAI